jgi:hypothetical protein
MERTSFALESTLSGVTYLEQIQRLKDIGYVIQIIFASVDWSGTGHQACGTPGEAGWASCACRGCASALCSRMA